MTIKLQLPDAVYASLLKGNARVQGPIALVSPREGNFNAYNRNRGKTSRREYRKLPHGRVSMNDESVRLTLNINLDERGIRPSDVIIYESAAASNFVEGVFPEISEYSEKSEKSEYSEYSEYSDKK